MTGEELLRTMGIMGSDHAMQGIEVTQGEVVLRGLTHNTLDKMHDKAHCPSKLSSYSNNPADYQEDDIGYVERKQAQFAVYLSYIDSGKIDFIFLQEVDIFCNSERLTNPEIIAYRDQVRDNFFLQLIEKGWDVSQTIDERRTKRLVTLYNASKLKLESNRGVLKDATGRKNTGWESTFTHIATGSKVALVNVHLDYNKPGVAYSGDISRYTHYMKKSGYLTVMGGDTNHPREELRGAIGDTRFATSFETDRDTGELSLHHRLTGRTNTLDSFFVAGTSMPSAKPVESQYFDESITLRDMPETIPSTAPTPAPIVFSPAASSYEIKPKPLRPLIKNQIDLFFPIGERYTKNVGITKNDDGTFLVTFMKKSDKEKFCQKFSESFPGDRGKCSYSAENPNHVVMDLKAIETLLNRVSASHSLPHRF